MHTFVLATILLGVGSAKAALLYGGLTEAPAAKDGQYYGTVAAPQPFTADDVDLGLAHANIYAAAFSDAVESGAASDVASANLGRGLEDAEEHDLPITRSSAAHLAAVRAVEAAHNSIQAGDVPLRRSAPQLFEADAYVLSYAGARNVGLNADARHAAGLSAANHVSEAAATHATVHLTHAAEGVSRLAKEAVESFTAAAYPDEADEE